MPTYLPEEFSFKILLMWRERGNYKQKQGKGWKERETFLSFLSVPFLTTNAIMPSIYLASIQYILFNT
jgi:hypothetical protein